MQRLEHIAQRRGAHENAIRELEGIKKIALEEKAEKTTAFVQKLIDKKNAEFQKSADQIKDQAVRDGMRTLRDDGWVKIKSGATTPEEVLRVTEET